MKTLSKKIIVVITTFSIWTEMAFAQSRNYTGHSGGTNWGSIADIVAKIGDFINTTVMPIIVSLGVIYFIWNLVHFVSKMDNEAERTKFRKYTINGIIGLFIMLSVWGILAIGTTTLFNSQPIIPQLPTSGN